MSPEPFSAAWFSALASIVVIDLILAGDNALVIGLAARNVPPASQRRVIVWGTVGAIAIRALLTAAVVWLLKIPGFLLIGGLALVYIGWKLTRGDDDSPHRVKAATGVRSAVQTIVVADAVMGVDNVLAVAGAAHGSMLLVLIGLAVSVPIVVWGSTLVLRWVARYPQILWLGAAVLGWTAAKMIASEPFVAAALHDRTALRALIYAVIVGGLVAAPIHRALRPGQRTEAAALIGVVLWLAAFGWLDALVSARADPGTEWRWDESLVDFVRWIGWIPVVVALAGRRKGRAEPAPGQRTP